MFSNLIESASHKREFKRRSSFFLLTTATYALLISIAGVVGVYAYDGRVAEQSTELTILSFVPLEPERTNIPQPHRNNVPRSHSAGETANISQPVRQQLVDRVDNPTNAPVNIGTTAGPLPAPSNAVVGSRDLDPPSSGKPGDDGAGTPAGPPAEAVNQVGSPPPLPAPAPKQVLHVSSVLNGKAIELPKPLYPLIAKSARVQGRVNVQVLIDESGKVISARAVSGHPLLVHEAQKAAYLARFSPTMLGEQRMKVSGLITYNFVLQ